MKRLSISDVPRQLASTATDSGGGGVLESFCEALEKRNRLIFKKFIASCNLHGIQRPLVNAVEAFMGDGGVGKRTLLQLLHSLFDLQKCFPGCEFGEFWKIANDMEDDDDEVMETHVTETGATETGATEKDATRALKTGASCASEPGVTEMGVTEMRVLETGASRSSEIGASHVSETGASHASETGATELRSTETCAMEVHATETRATETHVTETPATETPATETHVTETHVTEQDNGNSGSGDDQHSAGSGDGVVTTAKHVPNKIVAAVLTRWWYVTKANDHLLDNWDEWHALATSVVGAFGYSGKKGTIASSIVQLMGEPKLRCDAEFLRAFSKSFFHHFFKWLQGYDDYAQDYGYRSRNVAEFVFLAMTKLEQLCNGKWEQHDDFKYAMSAINNLPEPPDGVLAIADANGIQKYFKKQRVRENYNCFLEVYRTNFWKHFARWCDPEKLGVFAFAGEPECASSLAKWVLHGVVPDKGSEFKSIVHGCKINVHQYVTFLGHETMDNELRSKWRQHHVTASFQPALEKMASANANLWTSKDSEVVLFREYTQTAILPVMNSTHRVEFGVREASLCAMKLRNEAGRSSYAFIRSSVGKRANYSVNMEMKMSEKRRPNQHVGAGAKGERDVKSKIAKRKHGGDKEKEKDANIIERTARGTVRSKHMLITVTEMLRELKLIVGYNVEFESCRVRERWR
jgi:hypothetical protein